VLCHHRINARKQVRDAQYEVGLVRFYARYN